MTLEVAIAHRLGAFDLDVSFNAPNGITALFGRSGAGKTTVVNAVAGLLRPSSGAIALNGAPLFDSSRGIDLPAHRRRVGYVFQEGRLFPHLTVRQNLRFGQWFSRQPAAPREFDRIVELLDVAPLLERRPGALSGGEKQRVAIGRALLSSPRILLLDEPLAALDETRKSEILPYLERLRDEVRTPMLYVSHAIREVARLATTIVVLDGGRVAHSAPAAAVLADPDMFPLLGRQEAGTLMLASVVAHDAVDGLTEIEVSGGRLLTPRIGASPGSRLRVRIRAQDVILALTPPQDTSALNVLPVVVRRIGAHSGPIVDVALTCGSDDLLARITRRSLVRLGIEPGMACFAVLKSVAVTRRDIIVLDAADAALSRPA